MNSTKMPVIENIELMTARVPLPEGPWGDQILNRRDDGTERLLDLAEKYRGSKTDDTANA